MISKPLRRRLFAALLLSGFAIGAVLFWQSDRAFQFQLPLIMINLALASLGMTLLHFRWKRQEARLLDPKKAEDIFS